MKQLFCIISYFFQLHLMLHVCVRRFDVMSTVGNFLGTKHGHTHLLPVSLSRLVRSSNMLNWVPNADKSLTCKMFSIRDVHAGL